MQTLVNTTEDDSCEWHPLECEVFNILTDDYGYEEENWKYPENWGHKVCYYDLQPHNQ